MYNVCLCIMYVYIKICSKLKKVDEKLNTEVKYSQ